MEKNFHALLKEEGKKIDERRASVTFNKHSITIEEIDEEGYNLYGERFYNIYDAYDRLEQIGALKKRIDTEWSYARNKMP